MALETAVTIIQRVSAEVGIPVATAPFSSTDPNQALLIQLLNSAGKELANYYEWPELDKSWTIDASIDGTTGTYPLPSDFGWSHNGTFWDTVNGYPVNGPLQPKEWAAVRNSWAQGAGPTSKVFRQFGTSMEILPAPLASTDILTLEYTSRLWVKTAAATYQDSCTDPSDTPQIDGHVMSRLTKLRFLEAKGMATGAASAEFQAALDDATFKPLGAPVLRLNGTLPSRLIGYTNVPETGYGL